MPLSAPADPCAAPSDVMAPTIGPSCSTAACNYRVVTTLVDIPGDDPAGGAHLPSSGQRLSCETVRLQAPPGRQRRSAPVASCDELAGDLSDRHVVDWDVWTLLEGMCGSDVWSGLTTLPHTAVSRSSLSRGDTCIGLLDRGCDRTDRTSGEFSRLCALTNWKFKDRDVWVRSYGLRAWVLCDGTWTVAACIGTWRRMVERKRNVTGILRTPGHLADVLKSRVIGVWAQTLAHGKLVDAFGRARREAMDLRVAVRRQKLAAFEAALTGADSLCLSTALMARQTIATALRLARDKICDDRGYTPTARRGSAPFGPTMKIQPHAVGWSELSALLLSRAIWTVTLAHIAANDKDLVSTCVKEWRDAALRVRLRRAAFGGHVAVVTRKLLGVDMELLRDCLAAWGASVAQPREVTCVQTGHKVDMVLTVPHGLGARELGRLEKELRELRSLGDDFPVSADLQESLTHWRGRLRGPEGTPYEAGHF